MPALRPCRKAIVELPALVALVTAGCGGATTHDQSSHGGTDSGASGGGSAGHAPAAGAGGVEPGCDGFEEPFTSTQAIDHAMCAGQLRGCLVDYVRSSSNGTLDGSGRDASWGLQIVCPAEGTAWGAYPRAGLDFIMIESSFDGDCDSASYSPPAGTETLVPDAHARVQRISPYPGPFAGNRFAFMTGGCEPSEAQIRLEIDQRGPEGAETAHFYVWYSWTGQFVDLCGPCFADSSGCCADVY